MAEEFDSVDKTFKEIKRLTAQQPFEPFRIQVNGEDIAVDHRNSIAFHPEVPYLTIHTRTDIYKVAVAKVSLIRESYAS
jgi:hypothetical protein